MPQLFPILGHVAIAVIAMLVVYVVGGLVVLVMRRQRNKRAERQREHEQSQWGQSDIAEQLRMFEDLKRQIRREERLDRESNHKPFKIKSDSDPEAIPK